MGGSDVRFITTVDHHSSVTLLDDWRAIASPRDADVDRPNRGGRAESDPSVMLGLVLVLAANTVVVALRSSRLWSGSWRSPSP